jgi:hypothetical protein
MECPPPLLTCQASSRGLKSLLFGLAVVLYPLRLRPHRLERFDHGNAYISGDALLIHLRSLDETSLIALKMPKRQDMVSAVAWLRQSISTVD